MSTATIHSSREVLFVGPLNPHQDHTTGNTKIIERVQSNSVSIVPGLNSVFNLEHKNNHYYSNPQISFDVSYLTTNGYNERNFGLYTNGLDNVSGDYSGFFCKLETSEPNIFIAQSKDIKEGLRDNSTNKTIVGLGNCSLLSYSFSAAIGGLATSSASFNPLNLAVFGSGSGNWLPSVKTNQDSNGVRDTEYFFQLPSGNNYSLGDNDFDLNDSNTVNFIAPQDIVVTFPTGVGLIAKQHADNGLHVQSLTLSCETIRSDLFAMGKYYPIHRKLNFPIKVALDLSILVSEMEVSDIFNLRCADNKRDISIYLKKYCSDTIAMEFHLKGARLTNYSDSSSVNGRKQASLKYEVSINDPFDTGVNLFVKACQGTEALVPISTSYVSGVDAYGVPYVETVTSYSKTYLENA